MILTEAAHEESDGQPDHSAPTSEAYEPTYTDYVDDPDEAPDDTKPADSKSSEQDAAEISPASVQYL